MKTKFWTFIVLVVLLTPSLVLGHRSNIELTLYKAPFFAEPPFFYPSQCSGLFSIDGDRNYSSLRDFVYFYCNGGYTLTLDGPANTLVTLFGNPDYRVDRGYLIVRKTSDKRIWLKDLNYLEPGVWKTVEGDESYGDYQYYYRPFPSFSEKVASVKWGQWWNKLN